VKTTGIKPDFTIILGGHGIPPSFIGGINNCIKTLNMVAAAAMRKSFNKSFLFIINYDHFYK
jgi:hypothetical protein